MPPACSVPADPRCTRAAPASAPASAPDTRRPRPPHISRHISSARASPRRRTLATHTCILRCSGQATFSFAARPLAFQAGGQRTYTALTVSRCAASSTPRKCRARRARHLLARCRCAATVNPPHLSFTSGQPKRAPPQSAATTPRALPRTSGSKPRSIPWGYVGRLTALATQHQGSACSART